ncbi:MAG: nuclear transport factor 2 family protein [Candidatus Korobacteraceae bacterium]|jgi:ketosteroid isomerase-like protein
MSQANSNFARRAVLAVICAVLITLTLASPLQAAEPTGAAAEVAKNAEALRAAMVAGDEKQLNALTDDHLTYGHSHGMLQDKTAYVKFLVGPKAPGKFKWIKITDQTIVVVGHGRVALLRHHFDAENEEPDGKITKAHIMALQVWTKEKGSWKLVARQACPL